MAQTPPATRLICPLTAETLPEMQEECLAALRAGADAVEIRLDYLNRLPSETELAELIAACPVEVIVTCRPTRQGGRYDNDEGERLALLAKAAACGAAWVDIEDDVPPDQRPAGPVILSHHDFDRCPDDLGALAAELDASPAAGNKVAVVAAGPEDALRVLDVLRACRKPTIALGMGEAGVLSRIVCRKLGAAGTFAALSADRIAAPGQPTIGQFKDLFRWDAIGPATSCYGVIGCPVAQSMSPAIHNAAFAADGIDGVYVPLLIQPGADSFARFMDALLARPWLDWRGLSVTIPHKESALAYVGADCCDELAVQIGAVNTIALGPGGALRGDNTDYAAAMDALCDAMNIERAGLAGRAVAIIGAGGAARAIVAALAHIGAETVIYNRTVRRAEALAAEFGATAKPLAAAAKTDAEIVINCTPIGMHGHGGGSPLDEIPPAVRVVFDTIYNPIETPLLAEARRSGRVVVSGLEMFVNQAATQFEIWTGRPAPKDTMRQTVLAELTAPTEST